MIFQLLIVAEKMMKIARRAFPLIAVELRCNLRAIDVMLNCPRRCTHCAQRALAISTVANTRAHILSICVTCVSQVMLALHSQIESKSNFVGAPAKTAIIEFPGFRSAVARAAREGDALKCLPLSIGGHAVVRALFSSPRHRRTENVKNPST